MDGSEFSIAAAKYAISLAKMFAADVELIHVIINPPYIAYPAAGMMIPRYIEQAKTEADRWLTEARTIATKEGIKATAETILDVLSVSDTIVNYAHDHKSDLIVIGTHGRSVIKRFLLGSVASAVVAHAGCPVLVVR